MTLSREPVAQAGKVEYEALGKGVTFTTPPLEHETEITGPIAARLFISSSTRDADLFLIVRVFDPNGKELTFQGALDPNTPYRPGLASELPTGDLTRSEANRTNPTTRTTGLKR